MANSYCATTDIKTDMPDSALSSSSDYDVMLPLLCEQASRLIDREVGRWPGYFYPTTDSATRYFDGSGEIEQYIDEMVSLTSVAVAEDGGTASTSYTSYTENTDFYVWPYNYSALGVPIQRLDVDWNGSKAGWPDSRKSIKVTGVFGYSLTPPADVKRACQIQVMRWFMRAKQGFQDASASVAMGELIYMQALDPDVARLLAPYKIGNLAI